MAAARSLSDPCFPNSDPAQWKWVQIANTGVFKGHPQGPFELDAELFSEVIANFKADGIPIGFDFDHASEQPPTEGSVPQAGAPMQGWIHDMKATSDGLFALAEWSELARQYIKGGNYRYCSPAFRFNSKARKSGQPVGVRLSSVALTNKPFLNELQPLAASTTGVGGAAAEGSRMAMKFEGGAKAILAALKSADTTVLLTAAFTKLAHQPHEYMPAVKACLGMHELTTSAQCADRLEQLREHVESCGDATGAHEGVDLGSYTKPMRMLVGAVPGDTWEDVFDAVEALIQAAIEEHELKYHDGQAASSPAMSAAAAEASTQLSAAAAATPTTGASNMAGEQTNQAGAGAGASAGDATAATLELSLQAERGKTTELTTQLSAKDAEILRLTNEGKQRDDQARTKRVDDAFETYKDKMQLTDKHKVQMLLTLTHNPTVFEELYPVIKIGERHLVRNLSTQRTADGAGGTLPGGGSGAPAKVPSIRQLAIRLSSERGIPLGDAQREVYAAAQRARREAAAAGNGQGH